MGLFLGYVFFIWKSVMRRDLLISRGISSIGLLLILLFTFIMLSLFYSVVQVDELEIPQDEYTSDEFNSTISSYYNVSSIVENISTNVFTSTSQFVSLASSTSLGDIPV